MFYGEGCAPHYRKELWSQFALGETMTTRTCNAINSAAEVRLNEIVLCTVILASLTLAACSKVTKGTAPDVNTAKPTEPKKPTAAAMPMWLGNPERNFYGTGPWTDKPLEVAWDFETGSVRGRLHPDPWG